jgi:hypothetical protein
MLDIYRQDANLSRLGGGRYEELLARRLSNTEALTLIWCIENQVPMEDAPRNDYLVVHYEDLLGADLQAWNRMATFFGLQSAGWDTALLSSPSQQSSRDFNAAMLRAGGQPAWMRRMASEDLEQVDAILKMTGVTSYCVKDALPINRSAIDR